MPQIKNRLKNRQKYTPVAFLFVLFLFIFSVLSLFSSGVIESQDGWLYLSVSKNLYYQHQFSAIPNEFEEGKNVNISSYKDNHGVWRALYGSGYSIAMVPAVFIADLFYKIHNATPPKYFPLESDWPTHFFASFTNCFYTALLALILYVYGKKLGFTSQVNILLVFSTIFTTNIFPLSKSSFPHIIFTIFILLAFYALKKSKSEGKKQKLCYLTLVFISCFFAEKTYNSMALLLTVPAIVMYAFLLYREYIISFLSSKKNIYSYILLFLIFLSLCFAIYWKQIYPTLLALKIKTLLEGVWGILFSSGKSIFLYSPPLILLPIFWYKLKNSTIVPEVYSFLTLFIFFIVGYAQAHIFKGSFVEPIWYGGACWGPRYLGTLIPFAMILVCYIYPTF